MKLFWVFFWAFLFPVFLNAQDLSDCPQVVFETDSGTIRIALYNETPQHRDNMLKLVREGFYNGVLFHRVIDRFMIQSGDAGSKNAQPGQLLGGSDEAYKIPAEICWPKYFHKKGAVAAAREGSDTNPEWKSSMSQFYIVTGRRFSDNMLDDAEERIFRDTHKAVDIPEELRQVYRQVGGTPHLDTQYTVFGEVVEGLDVALRIQKAETDDNARPVTDIHIVKAYVAGEE